MLSSDIVKHLPYTSPFLFVEELAEVDENGASGHYTFPQDSFFYQGHFKDHPVTPGVILTETMAQIGVVCLGIYLLLSGEQPSTTPQIALTSNAVDFYLPVYPGERVSVKSEKIYFRFGKLKCQVEMRNAQGELVCKGTIAGMMKRS